MSLRVAVPQAPPGIGVTPDRLMENPPPPPAMVQVMPVSASEAHVNGPSWVSFP
jgi:hypothetical protein